MNWYYAEAGRQVGPVTDEELQQLVARGIVRADTLVWHEGLPGWKPWSEVRPAAAPDPTAASLDAGSGQPPVLAGPTARCAECGGTFPLEETVAFGSIHVCPACKPVYFQRLREGAATAAGAAAGAGAGAADSPGTLSPDDIAARDYDIDAGARVGDAWRMMTVPDMGVFGGSLLVMLVLLGIQLAGGIAGLVIPFAGLIATVIFTGPLLGGLSIYQLRHLRGEKTIPSQALGGFGPRFAGLIGAFALPWLGTMLPMIPAVIAAIAAVVTGFVSPGLLNPRPGSTPFANFNPNVPALVIAGVLFLASVAGVWFLTVMWRYTIPLVADKNLPTTEAMRLSWRVVRRHFWQHLWLHFLTSLVAFVGVFLLCIGTFFTQPIALAAWTVQYDRLFRDLAPRPR